MLPGVEAARRRRVNVNSGGATTSRRPSFCLYATNHKEFQFSSHESVESNPIRCDDEMLDAAAREAKERLDQRFRGKSKGGEGSQGRLKSQGNLQTSLYKLILKSDFENC